MAKSPSSMGSGGTFTAAMKEWYPQDALDEVIYKNNPFLGMVPKQESFVGDPYVQPIHYAHTNKRSADFATAASTLNGTGKIERFLVTTAADYAVADMSREVLKAAENDKGAFKQHFKFSVDDAILAAKRSLASALFGAGTGTVGVVGTLTATNTLITLDDTESVTNFEVGQFIGLSATDGGAILSSDYVEISGIDRDLGTLTFAADITGTIAAAAATNFISLRGDLNAKVTGLAGWVPSAAPGATAFFGVNRSVDTTRLGGVRYDASASSAPIEEVLMATAARLGREGAAPDCVFLSPAKWNELAQSLQTQRRYVSGAGKSSKADVGYTSIVIAGPSGDINVYSDHNCPGNRAYMLTMRTWKLISYGPAIEVFDDDGMFIRNAGSDSYEARIGGYSNLVCSAPGFNAVMLLA